MSTQPRPPFTRGLVILSDSIFSVYDTIGSYSWPSQIDAILYFDNREIMDQGYSGWTASDAQANISNYIDSASNDYPYDWVIELGSNDLAGSDLTTPQSVANNIFAICDALHADPRYGNGFVQIVFPRGTVAASTPAWFEARIECLDNTNSPLPGYQNGHVYSSATPDAFTVVDGSGHTILFRITTSGTSSIASPAFNFTIGATTSLGGGTVATSYGRALNDIFRDAANQAAHHYTVVNETDPDLVNATAYNNGTWWNSDKIHPNQASHLQKLLPNTYAPIFQQNGTSPAPYRAVSVKSIVPASAALGAPVTINLIEAGQPAVLHSIQIGGQDCTNITRLSDLQYTCNAPSTGISVGNTYGVTVNRIDGGTDTLANAFTVVQSFVRSLAFGNESYSNAEQIAASPLNSFPCHIRVAFGGGIAGLSAAHVNGVALTGLSTAAATDGSGDTIVSGTFPVGSYSATTGNVTVTSTDAPTQLVNGITMLTTFDMSIVAPAGNFRGWYRGDSLVGSPATAWNDKTANAQNATAANSPTVNATSAVFSQNGTGIQTVTTNGTTQKFTVATFNLNTVDNTPYSLVIVGKVTSGSVSNNIPIEYSTSGGAIRPQIPNTTFVPFTITGNGVGTATSTKTVLNTPAVIICTGDSQAAPTANVAISVNGETPVTASAASALSGLRKSAALGFCGGNSSSSVGGEFVEVALWDITLTAAQQKTVRLVSHNWSNSPI